ncbi:hypothetical protein V6N13_111156 [Hibiscus sabdariffa]
MVATHHDSNKGKREVSMAYRNDTDGRLWRARAMTMYNRRSCWRSSTLTVVENRWWRLGLVREVEGDVDGDAGEGHGRRREVTGEGLTWAENWV